MLNKAEIQNFSSKSHPEMNVSADLNSPARVRCHVCADDASSLGSPGALTSTSPLLRS